MLSLCLCFGLCFVYMVSIVACVMQYTSAMDTSKYYNVTGQTAGYLATIPVPSASPLIPRGEALLKHIPESQPMVALTPQRGQGVISPILDFTMKLPTKPEDWTRLGLIMGADPLMPPDMVADAVFSHRDFRRATLEVQRNVLAKVVLTLFGSQPVMGVCVVDDLRTCSDTDCFSRAAAYVEGVGDVPNHAKKEFHIGRSVHLLPGVPADKHGADVLRYLPQVHPGRGGSDSGKLYGNMLCVVPEEDIRTLCAGLEDDAIEAALRVTYLGTCVGESIGRKSNVMVKIGPRPLLG